MNTAERQIASERTGEILDNIKVVFARKGFEGASMQELAQAAQMSVGNFYRYFPSKDAIITALVEWDLRTVQNDFNEARSAADPRAAFRQIATRRMCGTSPDEAALWSEIEAASYRNPAIAEIRARVERTVRENIVESLRSLGNRPDAVSEDEFRARAEIVLLLVKGLAKKRGLEARSGGDANNARIAEGVLSIIDRLLFDADPGTGPHEGL